MCRHVRVRISGLVSGREVGVREDVGREGGRGHWEREEWGN